MYWRSNPYLSNGNVCTLFSCTLIFRVGIRHKSHKSQEARLHKKQQTNAPFVQNGGDDMKRCYSSENAKLVFGAVFLIMVVWSGGFVPMTCDAMKSEDFCLNT